MEGNAEMCICWNAGQGGWSQRLEWCSGRTQQMWVQNKELRHLSEILHISHINFCLLVLIISNTKALTVPCVRPKKTPKHRSPKAPYFAALMCFNAIFINATTKTVVRKRWSPRKNVYHGSPAGSFSSKEAKEAALRAATISSPFTYRFGELCNSLWVPLAYRAELCELAHLTCMLYPIFFPPSTLPCAEQTFSLTAWLMDIQKASLWAL